MAVVQVFTTGLHHLIDQVSPEMYEGILKSKPRPKCVFLCKQCDWWGVQAAGHYPATGTTTKHDADLTFCAASFDVDAGIWCHIQPWR